MAATDPGGSGVAETRCKLDPATVPATFDDIPAGCAYTGAGQDMDIDGIHTLYAASQDNVGNKEIPVSQTFKLDQTKPTISLASRLPAPNGNGWNTSAVTVTWTCTDATSGVASSSVSQTLSGEGANQAATGTCTDTAGNSQSNTQTGINIDLTKPTLAPTVAPNPVAVGRHATASANATDALSGIATQGCGPVDTSSPGVRTVLCTATDKAGNSASSLATYTVGNDLRVTAVSNPPPVLLPGGRLPVTDTTTNQGAGAVGSSVTAYYLALGTTHTATDIPLTGGLRIVPGLSAGAGSTGSVLAYVPSTTPVNAYYLLACADGYSRVAEGNEKNNCLASVTPVQVTLPDLTVTAVSNPPATATRGTRFALTYTVRNVGNVPAGPFVVSSYLSRGGVNVALLSATSLTSLAAATAASATVSVTVPSVPAGVYTVNVCVDTSNLQKELNEGNNCRQSAGTLTRK